MAINVPIISQFEDKGIKKAIAEFNKLEGPAQKAAFAIKKAFVPAAAAVGALGVAAFGAAQAAIEDQASQAKLADQLIRTTGATDQQIVAVEGYISAMQLATNVADTDLRGALSRLATVTGDVTQAQSLLQLATDISAATGKDLSAVTEALSKAYGGNLTALQRLDPSLRDLIKSGATFDEVGQQLTATFGGAAANAVNTAQGQFKNMQIRIGELQESIGALIVPIAEKFLPILQRVATFVENNTKLIVTLASVIGGLAVAVIAVNAAMTAYAAITKAVTVVTGLFNAVLAANPVVLVTLAIAALVAGLIIAYREFETFRNIVNNAFRVVQTVAQIVIDYIMARFNALKDVVMGFVTIIKGIFQGDLKMVLEGFKQLFSGAVNTVLNIFLAMPRAIWNAIGGTLLNLGRDMVNAIVDGIKSAAGGITNAIMGAIPGGGAIKGAMGAIGKILPFAEGGIVTAPTLGLIGEAGPEAVIPLDQMRNMRFGGGGGDINITVTSADPQAVIDAIRTYNRQQGPAPIRIAS